jgi:RNA polymerase sigma factor (TIGR02999 family)
MHPGDENRSDAAAGDGRKLEQVLPALYAELRSLAHQRLRRAPFERSLNTTGLVHEAYLRMVESVRTSFHDHDHFLAVSSRVMRNVLVDHARARGAVKRGGGVRLESLHEESWIADVDVDRVIGLNDALQRLELLDDRQARMIEQRYFGGLSLEEIARAMDLSLATVKRELRSARAWLAAELQDE